MLYNVQMKSVTASEARRNWFRLLDEVLEGEVVVLERKGRRIVLRCEKRRRGAKRKKIPDYRKILGSENVDEADRWGWEWLPDTGALSPRDTRSS